MTTPLNITSFNQGQIFGAKLSLENFERQLEADKATQAYNLICRTSSLFLNNANTAAQVLFSGKRVQPTERWPNAFK